MFWSVLFVGVRDSCAAFCEHARLPGYQFIQIVDIVKDLFPES